MLDSRLEYHRIVMQRIALRACALRGADDSHKMGLANLAILANSGVLVILLCLERNGLRDEPTL